MVLSFYGFFLLYFQPFFFNRFCVYLEKGSEDYKADDG